MSPVIGTDKRKRLSAITKSKVSNKSSACAVYLNSTEVELGQAFEASKMRAKYIASWIPESRLLDLLLQVGISWGIPLKFVFLLSYETIFFCDQVLHRRGSALCLAWVVG
jgi:hypothetical protein